VIRSAKELAQRGTIPKLTAQLEAEFGNRKAVQAAIRPLSDDSLYADLLKSQAPVNQSAIGVLVRRKSEFRVARVSGVGVRGCS